MARANRHFGDDPTFKSAAGTLEGFNPGGDDFAVLRQVDGHYPYEGGMEGANPNVPSAGDPHWNDPIGPQVED